MVITTNSPAPPIAPPTTAALWSDQIECWDGIVGIVEEGAMNVTDDADVEDGEAIGV